MPADPTSDRPSNAQFPGRETFEKLRWDILDGVLKPGERLPFAFLQSRYAVGVGTIREGLSSLAAEGLVQVDVGRGFRVAPVSRADLIDISELRVDFEKKALTDAIKHGDDDWEVRILTSFHLLAKMEAQPLSERLLDASRWTTIHRDFHRALVSSCKSHWLLHFQFVLFDQADRYRLLSLRHRPKTSNRQGEHQAIMEAVIQRNTERACELAELHIRRTVEHALQYSPQLT